MKKKLLIILLILGTGILLTTVFDGKNGIEIHFFNGNNESSGIKFYKDEEIKYSEGESLETTPDRIKVESPTRRYGYKPKINSGIASFFEDIDSESIEKAEDIEYQQAWIERNNQRKQLRDDYIHSGEVQMLAQLVRAEAGNQSQDGKERIVDVVLNRIDDERFPDSIKEVINQKGQFSCLYDGNYKKAASIMDESDYEAVLEELRLRDDDEVIYFTSGGFGKNGTPVYQLGDHYFCK